MLSMGLVVFCPDVQACQNTKDLIVVFLLLIHAMYNAKLFMANHYDVQMTLSFLLMALVGN